MESHRAVAPEGGSKATLTTLEVARRSGYSVQQVRDLERLGVIPRAPRSANGYRRYTQEHVGALGAYRALAVAAGPVVARRLLQDLRTAPLAEAAAAITALHAQLDRERRELLAARAALRAIAAEAGTDRAPEPSDAMSITELAQALGVRTSTLRHWEHEGLLKADRVTSLRVRTYDLDAIRRARIIAALRGAGYGIGAVGELLAALGHDVTATADIVAARLEHLGTRTVALLRAGADLADLITAARPDSTTDPGPAVGPGTRSPTRRRARPRPPGSPPGT